MVVADKSVELPTTPWVIASSGCAERVGEYLLEARVRTAQGLADRVASLVDSRPGDERAAIVEHTERMERTSAERTLWDVQAESITGPNEVQLLRFEDQAATDGCLADPRRRALAAERDRVIARGSLPP